MKYRIAITTNHNFRDGSRKDSWFYHCINSNIPFETESQETLKTELMQLMKNTPYDKLEVVVNIPFDFNLNFEIPES